MAEKKRKIDLSPEERERRSKLAKDLAKKGQFGGNQKGAGRPKTERAQKHVAERVKEDADKIYKALMLALNSESPSVKLKAAMALLEIEQKETELQIKEEQRRYQNLDREELLKLIGKAVDQLESKGINVGQIIESGAREAGRKRIEATVIEPRRSISAGE